VFGLFGNQEFDVKEKQRSPFYAALSDTYQRTKELQANVNNLDYSRICLTWHHIGQRLLDPCPNQKSLTTHQECAWPECAQPV